ncbi:MAG: hypothetical protein CMF31_09095 [Kordiimonas sp.]|nr:hypothetical protein [Kordiimonas sp.]|tara:strand:- start:565 stop:1116 length:552 start_codon:yes stop_codon:yes gene_type:complete
MADIDLSRLSILLAEDSPFLRSLLTNSLKILGVGTVTTVDDGGEAIKFLQLVKEDPMKAGVMSVDIVFTNWQMSPVDGMMLLRWIRRHKDSPDRFVPVVMVSGYSEPDRVREARDMGVTEFMAKPFTINSISEKLNSVIYKQRQFVHNNSYFGPDRRRRNVEIKGEDRRVNTYDTPGVEVVRV